jgi:YD repeat-containing protein
MKKLFQNRLKTILFIGNIFYFTFSQNMPNVIPPSPNAQQFHKYGDYPVSHFTGVPEINIPIYKIQYDDIELPIYLAYHASGIKVRDLHGIVGYGWTLMVGGMISRTIVGKCDFKYTIPELKRAYEVEPYEDFSYLGSFVGWSGQEHPIYDGEYDIYSYGINSKFGKFIFYNGEIVLLPNKPYKILKGGPNEALPWYFEIIDENGILYRFGSSIDDQDYATEGIQEGDLTSWLLTDIVSKVNPSNKIKIKYKDRAFYTVVDNSYFSYSFEDNFKHTDCIPYVNPSFPPTEGTFSQALITSTKTYYNSVPDEIIFRNGKIKFTYNSSTNMLTRIDIYNFNNSIIKSVLLSYTSYKLLKYLEFLNTNNQTEEKFQFEYYDENMEYPHHSYFDFWGYYNGGNLSLLHDWDDYKIYYNNSEYKVGNANRNANEQLMKRHTLHKITYPTGGRTEFEFQSHYYRHNNEILPAGGLRIKRIKSYDKDGIVPIETKEYVYSDINEIDTLGVMLVPPVSQLYRYTMRKMIYNTKCEANTCRVTVFNSEPNVDLCPLGSSVVYPDVVEYIGNKTGNIGKNIYHYSMPTYCFNWETINGNRFIDEFPGNNIDYKQFVCNVMPWGYGELLGKDVYQKNSNALLASEKYYYHNKFLNKIRGFIVMKYGMFNISGFINGAFPEEYFCNYEGEFIGRCFNYADYYIHVGESVLDSIVIIKDNIRTSTIYEYNQKSIVKKKTFNKSNGKKIITSYTYPSDYSSSPGSFVTAMVNANIIIKPVETVTYQTNNDGSNIQILSGNITTYKTGDSLGLPDKEYVLETASPINLSNFKFSSQAKGLLPGSGTPFPFSLQYIDSRYVEKVSYTYNYGNIVQIQKSGDIPTSYFWGYNNTYPVVKAANVTYNQLSESTGSIYGALSFDGITEPSKDATQRGKLKSFYNYLNTQLPNAMIYVYTYKPLVGMTSETDPNGVTTYYEYDSLGRLWRVYDQDLKIIKEYNYHYQNQ